MAKIKALLTIEVHYEDETETMSHVEMMEEAKSNLKSLSEMAANRGLLSGDSSMTVEEWSFKVETKAK